MFGLFGPVTGVTAWLECWEDAKFAGWKRGKDGNLRCPGLFEDWRWWRSGRRRACEGMASGSALGDRGELIEGMLRSAVRDMFWEEELEFERIREKDEGEVGLIWWWQVGLA